MSTELIVALVASGSSFLIAIISLITSIINNRQSIRSERELELLKFEIARTTAKTTIGDAQQNESLKALLSASEVIQFFRDETQVILEGALDHSVLSSVASERISEARKNVFSRHRDEMLHLSEWEAKAFHRAKNISLEIERIVHEARQDKSEILSLAPKKRQHLTFLRAELGDIQHLLRDSFYNRKLQQVEFDDSKLQQNQPPKKGRAIATTVQGPQTVDLENRHILYIEDNADNRNLIKRILESRGAKLELAAEAQSALQLLSKHNYDLILMDINLPGIDGYHLVAHIKSIPKWKNIKVIALTANNVRGAEAIALKQGYDGFIQKPVDPRTLPHQLQNFLEHPLF